MYQLEGDDYANKYWAEYDGPQWFKCLCHEIDNDSHKVQEGDICEVCNCELVEIDPPAEAFE